MKLLVTGDWHVGARTWGVDRTPEVRAALEVLISFARGWEPEGVVILGDVFDRFRYPGDESAEIVAMAFRAFLDLPCAPQVVFVRGNHDWAGVKIWELLAGERRLHVVDRIQFLALGDFDLLLVPYLRPHQIPHGESMETLLRSVWTRRENHNGLPLCLAHLALSGTVPGLREVTLDPSLLSDMGMASVICGHIHRHGQVTGPPIPSFYSGPLFPVDFAEEGQKIGAFLVDGGAIRSLPIPSRPLKTLEFIDLEGVLAGLEKALSGLSEETLVRVSVGHSDLPRSVLLDRFREMKGAHRVVQIKILQSGEDETAPVRDNLVLDIGSLWRQYVESEEPKGPRRELLMETGIALLAGEDPKVAWQSIRHMVLEGERD